MEETKAQVVALFNTNPDLLDIVRLGLERAGFIVVIGHVHDIRTGALELAPFMDQHRPKVVVYDLVMPYDRNWAFMKHVREHPVDGARTQCVESDVDRRSFRADRRLHHRWCLRVHGRPHRRVEQPDFGCRHSVDRDLRVCDHARRIADCG